MLIVKIVDIEFFIYEWKSYQDDRPIPSKSLRDIYRIDGIARVPEEGCPGQHKKGASETVYYNLSRTGYTISSILGSRSIFGGKALVGYLKRFGFIVPHFVQILTGMNITSINRLPTIGDNDKQFTLHPLTKEIPATGSGVLLYIVYEFAGQARHWRLHVLQKAGLRINHPLKDLLRPVMLSSFNGESRYRDVALMRIGPQQALCPRLKDVKEPLEADHFEIAIHIALQPGTRDSPPAAVFIDGKRSQKEGVKEWRLREVPFDGIRSGLRLMNDRKQRIKNTANPVIPWHTWNNYATHIGCKVL